MTAISGWMDPHPVVPSANASLAADVIANVAADVAKSEGVPSEPLLGASWSPDGIKYLLALCSTGGVSSALLHWQEKSATVPPCPCLTTSFSAPLSSLFTSPCARVCVLHALRSTDEMSNHLFCLREFTLLAGALNQTIVVPTGPHELAMPVSLVFDVPFLCACYGPKTALNLDEYKQFVSAVL
ncbi:unnamed protein product [Closterium sp. NIES-64]|nr:unnamed protein product [Closterium sp. NIES-64]